MVSFLKLSENHEKFVEKVDFYSSILPHEKEKKCLNFYHHQAEKLSRGPWWKKPAIVMRSPLSRTLHPANRFASEEEQFLAAVGSASQSDLPLPNLPDPYRKVGTVPPALLRILGKPAFRMQICTQHYKVIK